MQIDDSIAAFLDGNLTLPDLESELERWIADGGDRDAVLATLRRAFETGRLPEQIFQSLTVRLGEGPAESAVADEATRMAGADEKTRLAAEQVEEKTRLKPAAAEKTEVIHPPTEIAHPPTEIAHPPTEVVHPPTEVVHQPTEVIAAPETPVDFDVGTESNWEHPEEWTATDSSPIGTGSLVKNRFRLEEELGRGGMGVVYKARDLRKEEARDSDPWVGIKILSDEFRDHPQALVSLQREAVKAQKLAHPNIITVYDFDRDGTTIYMTMELMRGKSFGEIVNHMGYVGMDPASAVPMILDMAAGLAYAHERDIVHADFKPGNLFLTDDERVKILDFGIARATAGSENADWFDAGELGALTPGYASLEMIRGVEPHPADDVYALAIVAYMLLTGSHPYARKRADQALVEDLRPEPIKGLRKYQWRAIRDGLALRREDRIQDAGEFFRRFRGRSQVRKWLIASTAVSVAAAAFFYWQTTVDDPGPFPEDQRANFEMFMQAGHDMFALGVEENISGHFQSAAAGYGRAYEIHPRNPEAVEWLERTADRALESSLEDELPTTVRNLVCVPHLAEYRPVVRACRDVGEGICEARLAEGCL